MPQKTFFGAVLFLIYSSILIQCQSENTSQPLSLKHSQIPITEKVQKAEEIKVVEPKIPSNKKYVYITFDDGPNKGTKNVIQSLQKEKVPATLFLVGEHIYGSKAQMKDYEEIIQDTLFQIANHSFTHANNQFSKFYKDSAKVLEDFNRVNDRLNRKLLVARTPGRNIWRIGKIEKTDIQSSQKSADYLAQNQYKLVGWDIEWKSNSDYKIQQTSDELLNEIDSAFAKNSLVTENHLVLLTHDQYFRDSLSLAELDKFLQKIKLREDIELKKIKDYPGVSIEVN